MPDPPHRPRLHQDSARLDVSRRRLLTVYSTEADTITEFRARLELIEVYRASFPETWTGIREADNSWPRRAGLEVLCVLAVFGPRSVSELADHLRLSLRATSLRLAALTDRGLVHQTVVRRGAVVDHRMADLTPDGFITLERCLRSTQPNVTSVVLNHERRRHWAQDCLEEDDSRARREIARIRMKVPS